MLLEKQPKIDLSLDKIKSMMAKENKWHLPSPFFSNFTVRNGKYPSLLIRSSHGTNRNVEAVQNDMIAVLTKLTDCHGVYGSKRYAFQSEHSDSYTSKVSDHVKTNHFDRVIEIADHHSEEGMHVLIRTNQPDKMGWAKNVFEGDRLQGVRIGRGALPYQAGYPTDYIRISFPSDYYEQDVPRAVRQVAVFLSIINRLGGGETKGRSILLPFHNSKRKFPDPLNHIEVSHTTLEAIGAFENETVQVINPKNGLWDKGILFLNDTMEREGVYLSLSIRNNLGLAEEQPSSLLIHNLERIHVGQIKPQRIKEIKRNSVLVSNEVYERVKASDSAFEVVNNVTGASMDILQDQLKVDPNLNGSAIKLNYYQRELLDLDYPSVLTDYYIDKFVLESNLDQESLDFFRKKYKDGKVVKNLDFQEKNRLVGLLRKMDYFSISLYPLKEFSKKQQGTLNRLKQKFLTLFIGNTEIALKVIRPYTTDETNDVVRVSSNVLKLLGLQEADSILLLHRDKKVTARVLLIDSQSLIEETNIISKESDRNFSIGIPAHLRAKLDIKRIGKVCHVQRDMSYLFRKNLNLQFLPIMAVLFTALAINYPVQWKVVTAILLIPVGVYMSLSGVRIVSNKETDEDA